MPARETAALGRKGRETYADGQPTASDLHSGRLEQATTGTMECFEAARAKEASIAMHARSAREEMFPGVRRRCPDQVVCQERWARSGALCATDKGARGPQMGDTPVRTRPIGASRRTPGRRSAAHRTSAGTVPRLTMCGTLMSTVFVRAIWSARRRIVTACDQRFTRLP